MSWHKRFAGGFAGIALLLMIGMVQAARVSDIRSTKHNLSSTGPGTLKATSETQVCVFCHTPHGSTNGTTPLWNRKLASSTYTTYTSNSLDAIAIEGALAQPGGSSKLCLSCHDGTVAIGEVNVLAKPNSDPTNKSSIQAPTITMTGTNAGGVMASGSGTTTGFTRNLGTDLSNDHPISLTYSKALADRDGELRVVDTNQQWPNSGSPVAGLATGAIIGVRKFGYKPKLPLEPTSTFTVSGTITNPGQIQCATCHDPHITEGNPGAVDYGRAKFLRLSRFQAAPASGTYSQANDIICLSCHDKAGTSWAYSAHANSQVASPTYTSTAASLRDFPANLPVWQAACLNCHDTHTVQGSRRLLREGTSSTATGGFQLGIAPGDMSQSALENTCYQCHDGTTTVLNSVATVPNIKSDFGLTIKMPITSTNQAAGTEKHDIGGNTVDLAPAPVVDCTGLTNKCGADFIETRTLLGAGSSVNDTSKLVNRHVECTDCHNPHRVVKFRDFRGASGTFTITGTPEARGTHNHTTTTSTPAHTNIASGVLRGGWGVEPVSSSASFHSLPSDFIVKRGDPGTNTSALVTATYVTREYQICLKCHSNYGYSDNNLYGGTIASGTAGNRPSLINSFGGTPSGTNNLTVFTNQAKEFQAPSTHRGEGQSLGTEAGSADGSAKYNANNHRSWHPVMADTGRDSTARGGALASNWNHPFQTIGSQTMYCTDCHGSQVTSNSSVVPDRVTTGGAPAPWGPHGSNNNFLLKGIWNNTIVQTDSTLLCYKCHLESTYSGSTEAQTGFKTDKGDGHKVHRDKINGRVGGTATNNTFKCSYCHVAVPHGWKNKALLVNLNDVGEEAGQGVGSSKEVAISTAGTGTDTYNNAPYYMNAKLKVIGFKKSGAWTSSDCGSAGKSGTGLTTGVINGSGGSTNSTKTGLDWMQNTCKNPP